MDEDGNYIRKKEGAIFMKLKSRCRKPDSQEDEEFFGVVIYTHPPPPGKPEELTRDTTSEPLCTKQSLNRSVLGDTLQ
ncbi:hypothetical protein ABVT39_001869 [Epinephelus coioides]